MVFRDCSERVGGHAEPVGDTDSIDPSELAQIRALAAHHGPCRSVDVLETKPVRSHASPLEIELLTTRVMTLQHHGGLAASPIIWDT